MAKDNYRYKVGDKFVIEIGHSYWSPTLGNRYFIKGFDTLVFDDKGLDRLEKYRKELETCENCVWKWSDRRYPPCSVCNCNYDLVIESKFESKYVKE